nr:unnamed protein product [Callosobruchus chinensis]
MRKRASGGHDQRGKYIEEWVAALNLVIMNTGDTPTFQRGISASYIDVIGTTTDTARKVGKWEVLEGPDHIPPEVVKIAVRMIPDPILNIFNQKLRSQEFSKIWKHASVALIWKEKAVDNPSAFRPICMLSMFGKLLGRMLKARIEEELEEKGGLSDRQFGFRKGRSTVQAVEEVMDWVENSRKKWCVLVTLYVANAFIAAT